MRKIVSRERCREGPLSQLHYRQHFRKGSLEGEERSGANEGRLLEEQSPSECERLDVRGKKMREEEAEAGA